MMIIHVEFYYISGGNKYFGCQFKDTLKILKKVDLISELLKHSNLYNVTISNTSDINHVYEWLDNLRLLGIKYVFIDEITWADGFIDHSDVFISDLIFVSELGGNL